MEYLVEKENKAKKLSENEKEDIAKRISEEFKTYDRARSAQLDKAMHIKDEVFFKAVAKVETDESKRWKSRLKLCKMYMYHQILKAFIWKNTYANTNSMFDVSGESLEADDNSNKQKTALVDILEKMDYSKTLDKIIDNSLIYGELISFATWKKQTEEYRRPVDILDAIKEPQNALKIASAKMQGKEYYIDEKEIYNNPYIYYVDPANFVFDAAQKDEWETCPKINRTWKTPEYINSNKYFELTDAQRQDIRDIAKQQSDEQDLDSLQTELHKEEITSGSTVEMLEHFGDITLADGTVLRNWYAVVIAGKYLVRFEKNPLIINPFSYGAYVTDPDNGRGISPLYSIYDISLTQEDMLRRTMDMQALTENPPQFVPKGFYGEHPDNVELHPGKIMEYDQGLFPQLPMKQMEFAVNVFTEDLAYLGDLTSEISGIFPNMAGASESDRTTATEISTKVEGQLTRLKMLLDIINQYLILDNVKKVAKLKANFTFGNETVFVNNVNQPENVEITDEIRQADYRYTYADRSATSERFNYVDMIGQAVQMFVKSGLQINIDEFFTWYMEQKGVENPERFIMNQETIPPEVQQALLQNPQLAPIIQEMIRRVEMAKQGEQLPDSNEIPEEIQQPQVDESLPEQLSHLPGRNLLSE